MALFTACTQQEELSIAGSTTVLPVISRIAEQYQLQNPDINIIVNAGGSGVGISQLGTGLIDIGMTSREITDTERSKYPGVIFNTHSIGKDAVVPVISSEIYNAGITALSLHQIRQIYNGDIRNWSELGGPDREIFVIDKEASRGTRHVFMQAVFGNKEQAVSGANIVLGSNNEEQTAITQSDAAIGMLSFAWLNNDVKGLEITMADGVSIAPMLQNIINGRFPIIRDLLLVTNDDPENKVSRFLDFVYSDIGQEIVEESGYVRINR